MPINQLMNKQVISMLQEHIKWKDFCINSLNQNEFNNETISSTSKMMKKMFQRDKFFLELYLNAFVQHA